MSRALLLTVAALAAAGCGGTKSTSHATSPTGKAGEETCAPFGGGTAAQTSDNKPAQTLLLSTVKVDSETCADRIVFDFRPAGDQAPGYKVEYRPAAEAQTEDASGRHLPIAGNAFLVVRFEPAATADLSGAKLEKTYTGPRTITPVGLRFVRQVTKTGDFEAVLTWAIGLSKERPFKVTSSGSPPRLTIELG
jgi:hypothetical protein